MFSGTVKVSSPHLSLLSDQRVLSLIKLGRYGCRGTTQYTTAHVSSNFGSGSGLTSLLRGRIEQYGASRFERNAKNVSMSYLRSWPPC